MEKKEEQVTLEQVLGEDIPTLEETDTPETLTSENISSLLNFDPLEDDKQEEKPTKEYTTEVLENVEEIPSALSVEEIKEMMDYLKGSGRPEFMERMMTQTNEKLRETVKVMTILYLNRIPILLDYQAALQKNLLDTSKIPTMSYDEIAKVSASIQKEISELMTFSLNVTKSLSDVNVTPTKVERLANALMNVPESTRLRIEEIIQHDIDTQRR